MATNFPCDFVSDLKFTEEALDNPNSGIRLISPIKRGPSIRVGATDYPNAFQVTEGAVESDSDLFLVVAYDFSSGEYYARRING